VGSYAFNVAENGVVLKFDYTYTARLGREDHAREPAARLGADLQGRVHAAVQRLRQTLVLNANVANKVGVASKLEDFVMPEFDADITADSGNNIGTWSLGEAS
jgi:hypothetical protein